MSKPTKIALGRLISAYSRYLVGIKYPNARRLVYGKRSIRDVRDLMLYLRLQGVERASIMRINSFPYKGDFNAE
jgi:hypothetical protein